MQLNWLLPDEETVFSFCSRYRILAGHRLSAQTALDLFGHARLGTAHDFPCRLNRLAARLDGRLGDGESLVRHTIIPFFFPFNSADRAAAAVATLLGDRVDSLKYSLGLLTTGFRAAHPLKACPICLEQDLTDLAAQPWRLSHQLPGAWMCRRHKVPLLVSRLKINQTSRFLFMVPAEADLRSWWSDARSLERTTGPAMSLAEVVADLFDAGRARQQFSIAIAAKALQAEMEAKGFVRLSGRFDIRAAADDFLEFCDPLLPLPDMRPLPRSFGDAQRWIARLLHKPRSSMHPLRLAVPITWLFGSFSAFGKKYQEVTEAKPEDTKIEGFSPEFERDRRRDTFLNHLHDGASIRSASDKAGLSIQTGLAIAAENGIPINRRPSKLTEDVLERVFVLAKQGQPKNDIQKALSISRPTLDRVLRSTPGLAADHAAAAETIKLRVARAGWLELRESQPLLGTKGLRLLAGDLYMWLYRHDRPWLLEQQPPRNETSPSKMRINWDERDAALAQTVAHAAFVFSTEYPGRRMYLRHIKERVHDLSPLLRQLERLPLTTRAIEAATRKRARNTTGTAGNLQGI